MLGHVARCVSIFYQSVTLFGVSGRVCNPSYWDAGIWWWLEDGSSPWRLLVTLWQPHLVQNQNPLQKYLLLEQVLNWFLNSVLSLWCKPLKQLVHSNFYIGDKAFAERIEKFQKRRNILKDWFYDFFFRGSIFRQTYKQKVQTLIPIRYLVLRVKW